MRYPPVLPALVVAAGACASSVHDPALEANFGAPPCPGFSNHPDSVPGGPTGIPEQFTLPRTQLFNLTDIESMLLAEYQSIMREYEPPPQGTARVWILIDQRGRAAHVQISRTSGSIVIDQAAVRVASIYQFTPMVAETCAVPGWVELPISFRIRRG